VTQPGDLLAAMADRLETAEIPYMVVGSVAGSFHGHPRTTADVDIVIDPSAEALRAFVNALPDDEYYVSDTAAIEALDRRSSFNVIEHATGWKVDLLIRKDRAFTVTEFERRSGAPLFGRDTPVATAEDTIIAKLEWAPAGESERQLRDVAGILEVNGESLDRDYIGRWVEQLGLEDPWRRALGLAGDAPQG
jgi:hypothetical protein